MIRDGFNNIILRFNITKVGTPLSHENRKKEGNHFIDNSSLVVLFIGVSPVMMMMMMVATRGKKWSEWGVHSPYYWCLSAEFYLFLHFNRERRQGKYCTLERTCYCNFLPSVLPFPFFLLTSFMITIGKRYGLALDFSPRPIISNQIKSFQIPDGLTLYLQDLGPILNLNYMEKETFFQKKRERGLGLRKALRGTKFNLKKVIKIWCFDSEQTVLG